MPVEPEDTNVWPCRTPEDVLRDRTWARVRGLRRRRTVPVVAVVALVVIGLVALPRSASPVRVAAEGTGNPPAEQEASEGDAEQPTATTTTTRPPGDKSSVHPVPRPPEPPSHVVAPVVGRVPLFPREPVYSSSHPLLKDPEGDAWTQVEPARAESDPALDVTHLDVRANPTAITTELRVLDLGRAPLTSAHYGRPSALVYVTTIRLPNGYFSFYVARRLDDGSMSAAGTYWRANAEAADSGAYSGTDVADVKWAFDAGSGLVRVTAGFDALNRAMAVHGHPSIGTGTTVVPLGRAFAKYTPAPLQNVEASGDGVTSADPAYSYRLGD